jgi:epoxyqueuosine reductase
LNPNQATITRLFKEEAYRLGFSGIAIAKAQFMDEEAKKLDVWLNKNYHGEMSYMENHFDLRIDPTKLVPGSKSVVCLMYNYHTTSKQADVEAPKISNYALGRDYHKVVRKKLNALFDFLKSNVGTVDGRVFVDSAPVMERDWAKRSGLGWIGKNTLMITPQKGSYFFLAEIICDFEFEYDMPIRDHCGTCTRCIDACPTEAISPTGYLLDASKCISYLTIELKNEIPEAFKGKMGGYMYGCDICQEVCPWNRFSKPHEEPDFEPNDALISMTKAEWYELSEVTFDQIFAQSPVKRTKFKGLKRNLDFLKP